MAASNGDRIGLVQGFKGVLDQGVARYFLH
jgi:hypothetical protein